MTQRGNGCPPQYVQRAQTLECEVYYIIGSDSGMGGVELAQTLALEVHSVLRGLRLWSGRYIVCCVDSDSAMGCT